MSTCLTLFTATLVQDSALSVSGLDREASSDQPFALIDGRPTLVGRGLKGAAVAMARRFFHPLPRAVSDSSGGGALRRSAWEFADATTQAVPRLRAGVGILQKTGARAGGVLYDREVIPSGTKWSLTLRVDWLQAFDEEEGREAEGILGYILAHHWKEGRCWLGGGVARGLGWCQLDDLKAYRLDREAYDRWIASGRNKGSLPEPLKTIPVVEPTHSWCFRTLDLTISFGEYRPDPDSALWGLDMLAIGPHDAERRIQPTGDGSWAWPAWASKARAKELQELLTDRALLMEGGWPLLPGSSLRGPLRHAFSRRKRAAGCNVKDPHLAQGDIGADDPAGKAFGTVSRSSRILIRDARAKAGWAAARLHMHAEDEFSAGSFGNAKRDAVRLLKGVFPTRIVVEGPTPNEVDPLVELIDRLVALGRLGHLPVGGHKTRGAGWGRWEAEPWRNDDVQGARSWTPQADAAEPSRLTSSEPDFLSVPKDEDRGSTRIRKRHGQLDSAPFTLAGAAEVAQRAFGNRPLVAWWCDPAIDPTLASPPATFGRQWPTDKQLPVEEVAFFSPQAVWRAARKGDRAAYVFLEEVVSNEPDGEPVRVVHTPARLHNSRRFSSAPTGEKRVLLREWYDGEAILGFTITKVET